MRTEENVNRPPLRLARRMRGLKPSAVREILKVAERPEVTSLAGGLPAPELFPVEEIAQTYAKVLAESGPAALQYGATEGFLPLREWITQDLAKSGIPATPDRLLITNGSQQGIDLVARALLDPGDVVVVENPTYLAALQSFSASEAKIVPVPGDEGGMDVTALERVLRTHPVRLLYVVPQFGNPTGKTLAKDRRPALLELARRYGVTVLEDDPYGALRFRGETLPSLASMDSEVLYLGTFSKTLAPGLRVGWVQGPQEVIRKLALVKQACDLQTATLAQRVAAKLLETFDFPAHLVRLRQVYGARCQVMLSALESSMPPGTQWTKPDGGLFVWLTLPEGMRDLDVFQAAIARNVAVVPGSGFFVGGQDTSCLRLNYSNVPDERLRDAVIRLGEAMRTLEN